MTDTPAPTGDRRTFDEIKAVFVEQAFRSCGAAVLAIELTHHADEPAGFDQLDLTRALNTLSSGDVEGFAKKNPVVMRDVIAAAAAIGRGEPVMDEFPFTKRKFVEAALVRGANDVLERLMPGESVLTLSSLGEERRAALSAALQPEVRESKAAVQQAAEDIKNSAPAMRLGMSF